MITQGFVRENSYYDSLLLMRVNSQLLEMAGVEKAAVMMGTEQNKAILRGQNLITPKLEVAGPNDLILLVVAQSEVIAATALEKAREILVARPPQIELVRAPVVRTLDAALSCQPEANLVALSIPGPYVYDEAIESLKRGLNLFIFSSNVPIHQELELKRVAQQEGLLVMGPDCGTAIIGGVGLGFANRVRRGPVGLVGASGTGIQEVSCLIHRAGCGVSHAIGTGTNDVGARIGGLTILEGLRRLKADGNTEVIVVVSKPAAPAVMDRVFRTAAGSKPVVLCFLGAERRKLDEANLHWAYTLEGAAGLALALLPTSQQLDLGEEHELQSLAVYARSRLAPDQRFVRGLFSGGTLASEAALVLLAEGVDAVYTNTEVRGSSPLDDPHRSQGHTCVDLGVEELVIGIPHPMLEPARRKERIVAEATDPRTAVLLLDIVIGHGVHPDPATVLADSLVEARRLAESDGRYLPVVTSVCGVDEDPQSRSTQVAKLKAAGAIVAESNAAAARLAVSIASREK